MTAHMRALLLSALLFTANCAAQNDLATAPPQFGDFAMGFVASVADNAKPAGPSRTATPDEWETAIEKAVGERLNRYNGNKLYDIGIGVNAYALAVPGIPLVLSPKSALVISVDVWDDSAKMKINAAPKQFTIFEGMSGETLVGSGLTQTKEQQMEKLSFNAAARINEWLVENKAWFTPEAVAARAALSAAQAGGATKATSN